MRKRVIKVSLNLVITNAETRPLPPPRSLCRHLAKELADNRTTK